MNLIRFNSGDEILEINHSTTESPFGEVLIASTLKGICFLGFENENQSASKNLRKRFPHAVFKDQLEKCHKEAIGFFELSEGKLKNVKFHLKGTDFQFEVWKSLLKIPSGYVATYQEIAKRIGKPKASRAVGNAIGLNPVSCLIPCHRVIRSSGEEGGYMWGSDVKKQLLVWEKSKI